MMDVLDTQVLIAIGKGCNGVNALMAYLWWIHPVPRFSYETGKGIPIVKDLFWEYGVFLFPHCKQTTNGV